MSVRFVRSLGLAVLLASVLAIAGLAKGGYSFITIAGADLKDTVRASDAALTVSYFAFADFHRDRAEAPLDPGVGYEITRYYVDGKREIAFDRLHYYPATGFVYYDGMVNGSSEYDRKWYAAKPDIKSPFENALVSGPAIQVEAIKSQQGMTHETGMGSSQTKALADRTGSIKLLAIAASLFGTLLIFLSRRKLSWLTK